MTNKLIIIPIRTYPKSQVGTGHPVCPWNQWSALKVCALNMS